MTKDQADARLRQIVERCGDNFSKHQSEVEKLYNRARTDLDQARQRKNAVETRDCEDAVRVIAVCLTEMKKITEDMGKACGEAKAPSRRKKM